MASGTISPRPQAEGGSQGRYEDFILTRLEHTRRQVRLVDVASNLILLLAASLLFFLLSVIIDQWVVSRGLSLGACILLWSVWVVGVVLFVWRNVLPPLVHRINPVYAAAAIENGRPSLKNSLVNFLLLRSRRQDVAPIVYQAMEHRAAADLSRVPTDHAVDHRRVLHLSYGLAAVVVVFALYMVLSPKDALTSAVRIFWPWAGLPAPTRVHFKDIRPGNDVAFTEDRREVCARVTGLRDGEEVVLFFSTADGQVVDDRVTMVRADESDRYRCELPPGSGGLQQDTFYRIEAGDAATPQYRIEVQIAPTIIVDRVDYRFPPYAGIEERSIKGQGDIKALDGTRVTIHAAANMEIRDAKIDLNCQGLRTVPMKHDGTRASGEFTLALDPDPANRGRPQYDSYQVLFTDQQGRTVRRPIRYRIDVDPDLAPEVTVIEPQQEEVTVPVDGQVKIRLRAVDPDFGLRHVELKAEREARNSLGELLGNREGQKLTLPVLFDRPPPEKALAQPFESEYVFRPADFQLKSGDRVHYWVDAEDNREPVRNRAPVVKRLIRIAGSDQEMQKEQQNSRPDESQSQNGNAPQQGGQSKPGENGQGDQPGQPQNGDQPGQPAGDKANPAGGNTAQDPKKGDNPSKDNQAVGEQGKPKAGPDASGEKSDPSSSRADDQSNRHIDPKTQSADAVKEILKDRDQQKQQQPENSDPSKAEQNPDQNRNPGHQGDNQQGNSSQGGQKKDGAGEKQPGDKSAQPQPGSQGDSPDQKPQDSGQGRQSGDPRQGANQDSQGSPDNSKGSPQQGNSGSPQDASQGGQNSGKQPSGNPTSPKPNGGGQENKPNPSGGSKSGEKQDGQNSGGQKKQDSKQAGGKDGQQGSSGRPKPEDKQASGQQGGEKSGGNQADSEKKQPGSQSGGQENQLAQNAQKPDGQKKPSGSGSDSQNLPGGEKPDNKPKPEKTDAQGAGSGGQQKPEDKQEGGGQQSDGGGQQPKPGQGEQPGSSGGGKPSKGGPKGGNKGGTADGEPGQKDPGKSGEPTPQDGSGAPDSQVERDKSEQKTGDSHESLNQKSDTGQSPGNSPHDSKSSSETRGDRKGGGGAGGGQQEKKAGKGTAGTQKPADEGGSVSDEKGGDATGKKAGEAARTTERTGSSRKEPGKGDGEKRQPSDEPTAKNDSEQPQGKSSQNTGDDPEKSSGGKPGAESSGRSGQGGQGMPSGGSQSDGAGDGSPPNRPAEERADKADLDFSNKQVDLALEHLKQQLGKDRSELLDKLGWTKEEARKFLENIERLKRSSQKPGNDGSDGRKAYNEFLKDLNLRPRGTRIQGGQTGMDDLRNVRDAGQVEPPAEWADHFRAYSRSAAEGHK